MYRISGWGGGGTFLKLLIRVFIEGLFCFVSIGLQKLSIWQITIQNYYIQNIQRISKTASAK